ncbi:hypothetical protein BGZ60DRAFT_521339 [Tricladium varicosporioides]|nr:hypothetical protein BGZ60DRAFT_521339 [Hymenoscyphus varicosporioides]
MRLLELTNHGEFSLTGDLVNNIPPYAILSHTWGADAEEVTFRDLIDGTGKGKTGYTKIQFCGEQAKRDDLQYFWVDTCCIDKSNNTELSEAINSMFRWYHEAAKCYVYLSDVSTLNSNENNQSSGFTWELGFRKSRWFTRGWTLQELIAPISVEFFSRECKRLGNKRSLEQQVHEVTGIPISALRGSPLFDFSIPERISWAESRDTKRKEDKAYSLMGIFGIHMPLIYGEGREKALIRLRDEIDKHSRNFQREELSKIPQAALKPSWIVPFERNSRFTGRESELAQLEGMLFGEDRTTKIAITGLGGVGKTQLVLELVCRTKKKYKNISIIWIPAMGRESFQHAYLDAAQQLGIPGWEEDNVDIKRLVQDFLSKESAGKWLLVFDNADDIGMWIDRPRSERESGRLIEYLPRSAQGCIIFTTRDRKTAIKLAHQNILEVPEMNTDVATQLLQKYLVNHDLVSNKQDVNALLVQLTCLPLAIVQAAAYINENGIVLADYLSLLGDQEEEVIDLLSEEFEDEGRYHNVKNPVATTWLISFEQIRHRDPLAAEFLSFIACVDPKNVPQSLLPPGTSRKKEMDAIGTLDAYSFISRRPADLALDIHRLVHLATRGWLRKEDLLAEWTERAVVRVDNVFPNNKHQNRSVWRRYLAHAQYALGSNFSGKYREIRINLAWKVGRCLHSDGRWKEAEELIMQLIETQKRVLGQEHPDTLCSIANLALVYWNQGRWKEAEGLGLQVIELMKKLLGEEHPDTLYSRANLASVYWNQGRWKEAEELELQMIELMKKLLGEEHPDTLSIIANLALTYGSQGRWKEAEELQLQVIGPMKHLLGEEHPDMLCCIANLALTYGGQGRWKEAEELGLEVVGLRKKLLGEEHPDTLRSIANLALTYRDQGRWREAEELGLEVVGLRKKLLGEEHPDTLRSIANLALTYGGQGRWKEAEELGLEVVGRWKKLLEEEYPDILSRRWKEAEELGLEVVELRKRLLGEEHPDTLSSITNLASTYGCQGRQKEAEELQLQVIGPMKHLLGEEHPETLRSIASLALKYENQGRWKEAGELGIQLVKLRKKLLGEEHQTR